MSKKSAKLNFQDLPFLKLAAGFLLLVLSSTIVISDLSRTAVTPVGQTPEIYVSQMDNRIKAIKYNCPKDPARAGVTVAFPGAYDILLLGEFYGFAGLGLNDFQENHFSRCSQTGSLGYMESPDSSGGDDLIPLYVKIASQADSNCYDLGGSINACNPRNRNDCYVGAKAFMDTDTSSVSGKKIGYVHKPNNVAEGKSVRVSSGAGAVNLVDGNHQKNSSQWISEYAATHWIEIDLGEEKEVESVQLYMGSGTDYSSTLSGFTIGRCTQQDNDDDLCDPEDHANGWRTIITKSGNQEGVVRLTFDPVVARKIYLYSNAPVSQAKFYEMEVIGTPEEGLIPLYRTSKTNGWSNCLHITRGEGEGHWFGVAHISTYGLTTDRDSLGGYANPILLGYLEEEGYTPAEPTPTEEPTPTIAGPTPTTAGPTPTTAEPTPTQVPTGDGDISLTVKFDGVNSRPANDANQVVKIWGESLDRSVTLATKASPLSVTFTVDDQGLYSGTLNLTADQLDKHYRLVIKGPRHLGREFVDVVLREEGLVLTGDDQKLLPGDLNQDGLVDSSDVAIVNSNTTSGPNSAGDLNYDNYTTAADKILILTTLSVRQDPQ